MTAASGTRTRIPRLAGILAAALLLAGCAAEPPVLDAAVQLPPGVTEPFAGEQRAFITGDGRTALAEGVVFLPGRDDFPVARLIAEDAVALVGYSDLITVAAGISGRADAVRIVAVLPEAAALERQILPEADAAAPGFPQNAVTPAELSAAGVPGTVVVASLFTLERHPERLAAFLAALQQGWAEVSAEGDARDAFTLALDDAAQAGAVAALVEAGYPVRQEQLFDFSFLPTAPAEDSR